MGKQKKKRSKAKSSAATSVKEGEGAEDEKDGDENRLFQILRRSRICEESRRHRERPHPFWDTQPVPSIGSEYTQDSGPIDEIKGPDEVRQDPYPLPDQFEWCTCDVQDDTQADEIYHLLSDNYVEDDDCMFRFDYSIP